MKTRASARVFIFSGGTEPLACGFRRHAGSEQRCTMLHTSRSTFIAASSVEFGQRPNSTGVTPVPPNSLALRNPQEVIERENPAGMTVSPARLDGIAPHPVKANHFEGFG
jgi:hypothetical protein